MISSTEWHRWSGCRQHFFICEDGGSCVRGAEHDLTHPENKAHKEPGSGCKIDWNKCISAEMDDGRRIKVEHLTISSNKRWFNLYQISHTGSVALMCKWSMTDLGDTFIKLRCRCWNNTEPGGLQLMASLTPMSVNAEDDETEIFYKCWRFNNTACVCFFSVINAIRDLQM